MLSRKKKGFSKGKESKSKASKSKKLGKKSKSKGKGSKDEGGSSQAEPLVVAPASSPLSSSPVLRDRSNSLQNNKRDRDRAAAATGVTFDETVYDDLKVSNERSNDLSYNMRREKSILKKDSFNREDVNLHSANSMVTRENTRLNRENTLFPREKTLLRRENTKFEKDSSKYARFSRSRPETSLDGQLVDLVDCTESNEDFPAFNSDAVLRGPAQGTANNNNAKFDPANARKPFFTQNFDNRHRDSIVVWPFGDGTITLPKPPPRQARPPTILESPEGNEDKWVRINIGGTIFHTRKSTLSRCPGSRLTEIVCYDNIPSDVEREYRFDRSPVLFAYILDYYRSGFLHMPQDVCVHALRYELRFWRLPDSVIAPCCWETYSRPMQEDEVAKELDSVDPPWNIDTSCCGSESCRKQLWLLLEFPSSSWYATLWAVVYVLLVLASTASLILDTVHTCRVASKDSSRGDANETNKKQIMLNTTDSHPAIIIIEIVSSLFFSVDLVLRFYCSSPYRKFINILNTTDFLSIAAEWILLVLITFTDYWSDDVLLIVYKVCSFIRVLRVMRLFRLARTYKGLRIFMLAMMASIRELFLLLVLLFMGIVIFATMIYYAEFSDPNNNFPDIPFSFWWAVVTMTTVGYGDIYPQTHLGYAVGALCAVTGLLATGLPIPIIATNFQMYYSYAKIKDRVRKRATKELEEQKKAPVRLPKMKTFHHFDSLESTFIGFSRDTTAYTTAYNNEGFSPSRADSGVFDDKTKEYVERKDRPRGAGNRDKPSRKDYDKLRSDSIQGDLPPNKPARTDTLFSANPGTRDTTMISLGRTNMDFLNAENTLTDIGASSPRKSGSAESRA